MASIRQYASICIPGTVPPPDPSRDDRPGTVLAPPLPVPSRDDRPGTTLPSPHPRGPPGTIVPGRPIPQWPSRDDRPGKAPPPMAFPGRSSRDDLIQPPPQGPSQDDRPGKALGGEALRPSRDDRPGKGLGKGEGGSDPGKLPQDGMGIVAWPGRNYGARGSCFCFVYVAHTATGCVKLSNTLRSAVK